MVRIQNFFHLIIYNKINNITKNPREDTDAIACMEEL